MCVKAICCTLVRRISSTTTKAHVSAAYQSSNQPRDRHRTASGVKEEEERGRLLAGVAPSAERPARFVENGVQFQADIVQGQKTGAARGVRVRCGARGAGCTA